MDLVIFQYKGESVIIVNTWSIFTVRRIEKTMNVFVQRIVAIVLDFCRYFNALKKGWLELITIDFFF